MHDKIPSLARHASHQRHHGVPEISEVGLVIVGPRELHGPEELDAEDRVQEQEQGEDGPDVGQLGDGQDERHEELIQAPRKSQQAK